MKPTRIDPPYDFILTFHSNHGPISYSFWDKRWFQSKIAKIFPPSLTGFSLELSSGARNQKKLQRWRYQMVKN